MKDAGGHFAILLPLKGECYERMASRTSITALGSADFGINLHNRYGFGLTAKVWRGKTPGGLTF